MNGRCESCHLTNACGYQYKPTECSNYRKFSVKMGYEQCPICDGSATQDSIFSCQTCRGTGYVEVKLETSEYTGRF